MARRSPPAARISLFIRLSFFGGSSWRRFASTAYHRRRRTSTVTSWRHFGWGQARRAAASGRTAKTARGEANRASRPAKAGSTPEYPFRPTVAFQARVGFAQNSARGFPPEWRSARRSLQAGSAPPRQEPTRVARLAGREPHGIVDSIRREARVTGAPVARGLRSKRPYISGDPSSTLAEGSGPSTPPRSGRDEGSSARGPRSRDICSARRCPPRSGIAWIEAAVAAMAAHQRT